MAPLHVARLLAARLLVVPLLVAAVLPWPAAARAQAPAVSVEPILPVVTEGTGPLQAVVRLTDPAPTTTSVRVRTAPITASAGDFVVVDHVITFPPGATAAPVSVRVIDDAFDEPPEETFMLVLSDLRGLVPAQPTLTLAIRDEDELIRVSALPAPEGGTAELLLEREWPSSIPVALSVDLEPVEATPADYQLLDPVVVLDPGDIAASARIAILADDEEELAESFNARLGIVSAPPNATVLLSPPLLVMGIPADERKEPKPSDRSFRAELHGEVTRLITGPFERSDEVIGHAGSSSCQYRLELEGEGWTFSIAMDLPHLDTGVRYPVRTPIEHDGDAYIVRRIIDGAVRVAATGPDAPGPGTYYSAIGILAFSEIDTRFGAHENRPVVGRIQAQLERVEFESGPHPYSVERESREVHGQVMLDLTFGSDRALVDRLMGDCSRPE